MFDTTANIKLPAPARLGETDLLLRYPTDKEWYARAKARKFVTHNLGRGRKETKIPEPGEADAKLYEAISLNGSPSVTAAEAGNILDALALAQITDVHTEDGVAMVDMLTMTGRTVHRIQIPTADQVLQWRRGGVKVYELAHGQQEIRLNPEAGAELYDACKGESAEYSNGIPGIHKDHAIKAVIEFIDQNVGPRLDDANF